MASSVRGVEVNEFSRFIDHTLATPWETFVSDIEKRLKTVQGHSAVSSSNTAHGSVEFMGIEFEVQKAVIYYHSQNFRGSNLPEKLLRLISKKKRNAMTTIFIYATESNGNNAIDPSLRSSILSALSVAIRSLPELTLPVFFTLNSLKSPNVDWIGYRPIITNSNVDHRLVSWSRYESLSMMIQRLAEKHPLFFFDGIRKVYQHHITALGLNVDERVMERFVSDITHFYFFGIAQWLGQNDNRPKFPTIPNILNRDLDELLRMLLLRKMTFTMENLTGINVSIDFRESNQHGIIDNESYSTLLPSRQSAQQFSIFPEWKTAELKQPFSESETMVLPWKAHSIRNLLVFLILASFTKKQGDIGYNFESNYTLDELMQGVFYEDMAEFVGQLSIPTQTAFYHKIPTTNIAAAASVSTSGPSQSQGGSSSRSSSRSMTPLPSMLFPVSVAEAITPKAPSSGGSVTGRGQSISTVSSNASLATSTGNNNPEPQQAIENDRYFQPILRYLFETEPSASLTELLGPGPAGSGAILGKHLGPGMFLDVIDLSGGTDSPIENTSEKSAMREQILLPNPTDGVHVWLEQFAIIAGLLPTKTTNIIRLWQHCLRELQQHYDLQAPVPAFAHIVSSNGSDSHPVSSSGSTAGTLREEDEVLSKRRAFIATERAKPLYARMLWEDVLHRKGIEEDISLTMPHPPSHSLFIPTYLQPSFSKSGVDQPSNFPKDPFLEAAEHSKNEYSSVLLQQLQMVHFCTVVQGESSYASRPVTTTGNSQFVQPPSLLRRIPLTEDTQALQQHLSQKMYNDTSRTFQANPLLKFQVVLPNLVSHMQSFKQANSTATVKDFYHWYGLNTAPASLFATIVEDENDSEDHDDVQESGPSSFSDPSAASYLASIANDDGSEIDSNMKKAVVNERSKDDRMKERLLERLEVIWQMHCSDNPVADSSKPVFSADKEMTKAMAALERMSVAGFAEELLFLAVCHVWRLLQHSVCSLASEEARRMARRAMQPLIHEIQQLHRLRARYPSSTYTSIMKRMFMQSMDAVASVSGTAEAGAVASQKETEKTEKAAVPSLSPLPTSTNGNNVTSLQQLVSCYDRLADCLARVEDLVHRLVQLTPVKDSSFFASFPTGSDASESTISLKSTSSRGKKVTVTRTTSNQSNDTHRGPSQSRWWRMLKAWLPQSRLPITSPVKSLHAITEYRLREDDEKIALLQRMKQLTMTPMTVATAASDWHSSDGRELGAPNAKKFVLRALLPQNMSGDVGEDEARRNAISMHPSRNPIDDATAVPAVKLSFDEDDAIESSSGDRERSTVREKAEEYASSEDDSDGDAALNESSYSQNDNDVALTVYCDRQELQAMWEFLEED
jgi:hypothetical protein